MTTSKLITAIIVLILAGGLLGLAIRHFLERGYLLNNAYIYASKKERETMDKKPYYRQSAIVFCLLCAVFTAMGLSLILQEDRILLLEIPLTAGVLIYAVVSSIQISKKEAKKSDANGKRDCS